MFTKYLISAGVPFLMDIVKETLGSSDDENAKIAYKALNNVKQVPRNEVLESVILKSDAKIISSINQSLQKEVASNDKYVRRMRPTFAICAASFGLRIIV